MSMSVPMDQAFAPRNAQTRQDHTCVRVEQATGLRATLGTALVILIFCFICLYTRPAGPVRLSSLVIQN